MPAAPLLSLDARHPCVRADIQCYFMYTGSRRSLRTTFQRSAVMPVHQCAPPAQALAAAVPKNSQSMCDAGPGASPAAARATKPGSSLSVCGARAALPPPPPTPTAAPSTSPAPTTGATPTTSAAPTTTPRPSTSPAPTTSAAPTSTPRPSVAPTPPGQGDNLTLTQTQARLGARCRLQTYCIVAATIHHVHRLSSAQVCGIVALAPMASCRIPAVSRQSPPSFRW